MKKNLKDSIILVLSIALLLTAVGFTYKIYQTGEEMKVLKQRTEEISQNAVNLYKIAEIMDLYERDYINPMAEDEDFYMDMMLKALSLSMNDKYGGYITADEASTVEKDLSGEYTGVGILVAYPENADYIVVEEVYEGTSADGILNLGDKIFAINGIPAQTEEGIIELRNISTSGAESVTLTLETGDVVIPLKKVVIDVVKMNVDNGIATISISDFTENSGNEFVKEFDELLKNNKITHLIFDVRNNGGGDKDAVTKIVDRLAPEGEIYTETYKNYENVVMSDSICVDIPIYILANENSASASELFIMSLQDTNNATFVGTQTFGKSTILGYYPLADGSSVLMSVGYYYPPSDRYIEGIGIEPDVVEENDAMAVALKMIKGE